MKHWVALGLLALMMAGSAARACPAMMPPPPIPPIAGESADDYAQRQAVREAELVEEAKRRQARGEGYEHGYEVALWETASQILLVEGVCPSARVDVLDKDGTVTATRPGLALRVIDRPRAGGSADRFDLTCQRITTCGLDGFVELVEAPPGTRFLVFANEGELGMRTVVKAYSAQSAMTGHSSKAFRNAQ